MCRLYPHNLFARTTAHFITSKTGVFDADNAALRGYEMASEIYRCGFTANGYNGAMKKSLTHLPQDKQDELELIRDIILEKVPDVRMIVLFGSYARDEWVEDTHLEGHVTHVYESDFDILVATKSKKVAEDSKVHDTVEQNINATGKVDTPYGIIYHSFSYVKQMITEGHYFFTDIQKEGIYLFRTHKHKIGAIKTIPPEERKNCRRTFQSMVQKCKRFLSTIRKCSRNARI